MGNLKSAVKTESSFSKKTILEKKTWVEST